MPKKRSTPRSAIPDRPKTIESKQAESVVVNAQPVSVNEEIGNDETQTQKIEETQQQTSEVEGAPPVGEDPVEFVVPKLVYASPGPHQAPGGTFQWKLTTTSEEVVRALKDGWFLTITEAVEQSGGK